MFIGRYLESDYERMLGSTTSSDESYVILNLHPISDHFQILRLWHLWLEQACH